MSKKIVYAVVVTYKRRQLLQQVLDALINQTYSLSKILIIDNNSLDGTQELVEKMSCGDFLGGCEIEYHNTFANLGGAGGFEYGFKIADSHLRYDYLWLMDDDLLPDLDCLETLLGTGEQGAEIVQPLRVNLDGSCAELSPVVYDLSTPWLINPKRQSVMQKIESIDCAQSFEIAGIPFEGPLISKSIIDKIGYPNPDFFIFNDDLDYAIRARKAGAKILCEPQAKATRLLVNSQVNDLNSWKGYFMLRNHFYILHMYGDNFLVKSRPLAMTLCFCLLHCVKGNFSLVRKCFQAFLDSKELSNNDTYRP